MKYAALSMSALACLLGLRSIAAETHAVAKVEIFAVVEGECARCRQARIRNVYTRSERVALSELPVATLSAPEISSIVPVEIQTLAGSAEWKLRLNLTLRGYEVIDRETESLGRRKLVAIVIGDMPVGIQMLSGVGAGLIGSFHSRAEAVRFLDLAAKRRQDSA